MPWNRKPTKNGSIPSRAGRRQQTRINLSGSQLQARIPDREVQISRAELTLVQRSHALRYMICISYGLCEANKYLANRSSVVKYLIS